MFIKKYLLKLSGWVSKLKPLEILKTYFENARSVTFFQLEQSFGTISSFILNQVTKGRVPVTRTTVILFALLQINLILSIVFSTIYMILNASTVVELINLGTISYSYWFSKKLLLTSFNNIFQLFWLSLWHLLDFWRYLW